MPNWSISDERYQVIELSYEDLKKEQEVAFEMFRAAIKPWVNQRFGLGVALGGESNDGGWSLIYENKLWIVFIGEKGQRYNPCFFTNVWDALNFIGYQMTCHHSDFKGFQPLSPPIAL